MKLSRTVGPGAIGIRLSQLKEATFHGTACRTSSYIQPFGTPGDIFTDAPEIGRRLSVGPTHIHSASPLGSHVHAPVFPDSLLVENEGRYYEYFSWKTTQAR